MGRRLLIGAAIFIYIIDGSVSTTCGLYTVESVFAWSTLSYNTPAGFQPDPSYSKNDSYITGVESIGDNLFVSSPRSISNIPATLSSIPKNKTLAGTAEPVLEPFPDLSWNTLNGDGTDCSKTLVSVHRTAKDKCNRLWVLDSGVINNLRGTVKNVCPPKIVLFDVNTKQTVRIINIPDSVLTPVSILENIVFDETFVSANGSTRRSNSCTDLYAYIADTNAPAVIVLKSPENIFYRFSHPYMYPDPDYPYFTLGNEMFIQFLGIIGMDVDGTGLSRRLYFQPFSSYNTFSLATSILQAPPNTSVDYILPAQKEFTKTSGANALRTDTEGCLLYNPITERSIVARNNLLDTERTLVRNPSLFSVVFDIKRDSQNTKLMYAANSYYPRYVKGTANSDSINIRILSLQKIV